MRRATTSVTDVSTVMALQLREDLLQAAQGNTLLSRDEQAVAMPHIQKAAEEVRAAGGTGTRVTTDALEQNLMTAALRLIDSVNQPSGRGAQYLSKTEAWNAFRAGGRVGEAVLRAYEVASGNGLDVDELAKSYVTRDIPTTTAFMTFATDHEAMAYADPEGREVVWLVAEQDGLLSKRFVAGRNDLWTQRFEIDRLTGALTVTAEH